MLKTADIQISRRLRGLSGWAALGLVLLGTITGLTTFLLLTRVTPIEPTEQLITSLLYANGVLVFLMGAMIAGQIFHLLLERRRGTAGTGLHIRLISLFSLVALVPAILVAVFATVTLNRGLDTWFSERTRGIVETAATVADAYLLNASEATRTDIANISADLVQQLPDFNNDRPAFQRRVARHAALRNLAAIFILDRSNNEVVIAATANEKIKFIAPTADSLARADKGELVVLPPGRGGILVRALIKLQGYPSHYLYAYRVLSPIVVEQLTKTKEAKAEYDRLLKQRVGVQLTFGLVYALVAMVFLLASIWAGMWFSDRLVAPIVRLLSAARNVAQGDFDAKVNVIDGPGDLMTLSQTFNMMTDQIRLHRDQLVETNEQLDDRRRFTEAMLSGVSAGVIGIDPDHRISLVNRSALTLLGQTERNLLGHSLDIRLPDFAPIYITALSRPSGAAEGQVDIQVNGQDVSFIVRITTERSDGAEHGYVLTFDDITQLVSAQRNSAWSDIARRIAHEIKNPLTPIQLSAERLKRKYLKEIKTDRHVFEQCTDTIIRQVGDLGRIVDEFSSFARMPKAIPEPNNLSDVVREATVLQRVTSSELDIELELDSTPIEFPFDRRLITQAITNLVKNAGEAIEARDVGDVRGQIIVVTGVADGVPFVSVQDNGVGLPQENRNKLAEPYMTTREKGTGLGLAIVKRIMEEHGGRLKLEDSPTGQGALVTLFFALQFEQTISLTELETHGR
jgi:two-component system, NtrC family, nitrogen regulation sensor histidine kinase NtrY